MESKQLVQKQLAKLRSLSQKMINNEEIDESEFEDVIEIVSIFKNATKEDINEYFGNELSNDEQAVFFNFHKNIQNIKTIIEALSEGKKISKKAERDYFFNGKYLNKLLFSDEYREILEYIQKELNLKVKAELFSDIKIYFEKDCFEEDKSLDPAFKHLVELKSTSPEILAAAIIKKSEERNIPVIIREDARTGERTIEIGVTTKSKLGIAKPGHLDCAKSTPHGLVICLTTADGKIGKIQEQKQLEKHISCIENGIKKEAFVFEKNGELQKVSSIDEINEIRFGLVTEFSAKINHDLQDHLSSLGIDNEKVTFLEGCMLPFLKSHKLSDEIKNKIILDGYACAGLSNYELQNLEEFLTKEIDKLIKNKDRIIELMTAGAYQWINDYFEKLTSFLKESGHIIRISDYDKFCNSIIELSNTFKETPCFDLLKSIELEEIFVPEFLKKRNSTYKSAFKATQDKELQRQISFTDSNSKVRDEINQELEAMGVKELNIETKLRFNKLKSDRNRLYNSLQTIKNQKEIERKTLSMEGCCRILGKSINKESWFNLSIAESLYIENNPHFLDKVKKLYDYDRRQIDQQYWKYSKDPKYAKLIHRIKLQQPNRRVKSI